jgi:hypothetical protein
LRQVEEELSPFKKTHTEKASLSVGSFFSPSSGSWLFASFLSFHC